MTFVKAIYKFTIYRPDGLTLRVHLVGRNLKKRLKKKYIYIIYIFLGGQKNIFGGPKKFVKRTVR